MDRDGFLQRMQRLLRRQGIGQEQIKDILADYQEFFDAGVAEGKSEEEICRTFGSPEQVVTAIAGGMYVSFPQLRLEKRKTLKRAGTLLVLALSAVIWVGYYFLSTRVYFDNGFLYHTSIAFFELIFPLALAFSAASLSRLWAAPQLPAKGLRGFIAAGFLVLAGLAVHIDTLYRKIVGMINPGGPDEIQVLRVFRLPLNRSGPYLEKVSLFCAALTAVLVLLLFLLCLHGSKHAACGFFINAGIYAYLCNFCALMHQLDDPAYMMGNYWRLVTCTLLPALAFAAVFFLIRCLAARFGRTHRPKEGAR